MASVPSELSEIRRAKFLARLAECGQITRAAFDVGWHPVSAHRWKEKNEQFADEWRAALEIYADGIEAEAYRRGVQGVDKPLSHQGQLSYVFQRDANGVLIKDADGHYITEMDDRGRPKVVTVKEYSDSILLAMLKAKRAREYGDKSKLELSGPDGGPVKTEETPTAIGRKIAFALAVAMRDKEQEATVIPDDGSDMA